MNEMQRLIWEFGEAALRLAHLGALEGAAGNMSVYIPGDRPEVRAALAVTFAQESDWDPPAGPTLPTGTLVITGTGRRLRDVAHDPASVLCTVTFSNDVPPRLHHAPASGVRPTSEIDTHIGIHAAVATRGDGRIHSVIHAQPPHLTWLSHIPEYRDFVRLNRQLFRWQPETIVMLPEGIAVLPFETPGTPEQGRMTTDAAMHHRVIVWAKHGVVAHTAAGPLAAADLIDYAEAAARYEVMDMQAGRIADAMSLDEIRAVARRFAVTTTLLDVVPEDRLGARDK